MDRVPRAFKDTELNKIRVSKNIKIKERAKAIHFSRGIVGMYFSGQRLPTAKTCEAICDFLEVDPVVGMSEFMRANKAWDAEHRRQLKLRGKTQVKEKNLKMRNLRVGCKTFWSQKRHDAKLSIKDLSALTEVSYSMISKYLTGQVMPSDEKIRIMCDLFAVDFKEGKQEFRKAYIAWHKRYDEDKSEEVATNTVNYSLVEKVANIVYGKVSFEDFKSLMTGTPIDLSHFYGKVDFETFNTILQAVKDGN